MKDEVRIVSEEFVSHNIIKVTLTDKGNKNDNYHDVSVTVKFEDLASTSLYLNGEYCDSFEFTFEGHAERYTFLEAFKMIVRELSDGTEDRT